MYYNTLTLNSSHILNTQQYRIYARVITGDGTGIIRNNGANGGNGAAVAAGGQGVGILASSTGRTFASVNGGNGGGIGPGNGGSGGNCSTGLGANGARGGDSKSGQTGGAGAVQSTNIGFLQRLLSFLSLPTGTGVYATGGGGGGGGGFLNSGGGGGGAPAGAVWIQAESIFFWRSLFDCDSGCGGGGGFIFVLYKTLLGGFNLNASTSVARGLNGTGNSTNSTTAQDGNKVLKQIT